MTPTTPTLTTRTAALLAHHLAHAGTAATAIAQAPGRVNLLGEHTDYSGGFCMPAALSFNTLVATSPRADNTLRLHSLDFNESVTLQLEEVRRPANLPAALPAQDHWSAYPAGVAWALAERGIPLIAADLSITGNVPLGSGLSSSASIEVSTATALLTLANATLPKPQIALACQRAENVYVGAPCGIMDQFISALGVRGNALAIDTRALTFQLAPIPDEFRLVVCNSMVRHSIAGGEYGTRRREVEEAAAAIAATKPAPDDPTHVQLRDFSLADLEDARSDMSPEAFLRARHVISDSQRVLDGVACLRAGDAARFGRLMTEAHASFRDDFAASCPRCDLLVTLALALPGCLGSRLTGGGFGGCTVSLVHAAQAESFAATLAQQYQAQTGVTPHTFICEIANGAGPLPLP